MFSDYLILIIFCFISIYLSIFTGVGLVTLIEIIIISNIPILTTPLFNNYIRGNNFNLDDFILTSSFIGYFLYDVISLRGMDSYNFHYFNRTWKSILSFFLLLFSLIGLNIATILLFDLDDSKLLFLNTIISILNYFNSLYFSKMNNLLKLNLTKYSYLQLFILIRVATLSEEYYYLLLFSCLILFLLSICNLKKLILNILWNIYITSCFFYIIKSYDIIVFLKFLVINLIFFEIIIKFSYFRNNNLRLSCKYSKISLPPGRYKVRLCVNNWILKEMGLVLDYPFLEIFGIYFKHWFILLEKMENDDYRGYVEDRTNDEKNIDINSFDNRTIRRIDNGDRRSPKIRILHDNHTYFKIELDFDELGVNYYKYTPINNQDINITTMILNNWSFDIVDDYPVKIKKFNYKMKNEYFYSIFDSSCIELAQGVFKYDNKNIVMSLNNILSKLMKFYFSCFDFIFDPLFCTRYHDEILRNNQNLERKIINTRNFCFINMLLLTIYFQNIEIRMIIKKLLSCN